MRLSLAAVFAALVWLAPQVALAHGNAHHAALTHEEQKPAQAEASSASASVSPSCPYDSPAGCGCPSVTGCNGGAKLPPVPGATWRPVVAGLPVLIDPAPVSFRSRPDFSVLVRAPPAGR